MKKIWAIGCVVGFTAFWTFGFIALGETFGQRPVHAANFMLCLTGLGIGLYCWFRIMKMSPRMHRQRAAARARLEEEFQESQN